MQQAYGAARLEFATRSDCLSPLVGLDPGNILHERRSLLCLRALLGDMPQRSLEVSQLAQHLFGCDLQLLGPLTFHLSNL